MTKQQDIALMKVMHSRINHQLQPPMKKAAERPNLLNMRLQLAANKQQSVFCIEDDYAPSIYYI